MTEGTTGGTGVEEVDAVVVGAGVVGIAIARALAAAGREVIVLESADDIGTGVSSRNSEVIHAGIYYPKGSLMARLCVAGRRKLYEFCAEHGVAARRCGKLIVATSAEEDAQLGRVRERAEANGVEGLRLLSAGQARELEPELACTSALISPETGIVDAHGYMTALRRDAESRGALFVFRSPVLSGRAVDGGTEILLGDADGTRLRCRLLVNAAGLGAVRLARALEGMPAALVPGQHFSKGNYFTLAGASPFSRLIYPLPTPGSLGVHLTLDLDGRTRFGPDVERLDPGWADSLWAGAPDYSVDPRRADGFYEAVRKYWPGLEDGALMPAYSGVRPRITPPGAPGSDFVLQDADDHGVAGLINLFGIESPGLTSAIALADLVAVRAGG